MSVKEDSRNGETFRLDSARIIFRLMSRVVLRFPCLESLEAVRDFSGSVTSALTKTVVAEREQLAKRIKDPKRLETPLLRAIRHVRDYYVTDVRDYPDDLVATRIARWTDKMKQLPHYRS